MNLNFPTLNFSDIASIATLIALLIALWQFLIARKQTQELSKIGESLSTRYIGGLHDYYPSVIELIENAQDNIAILCDYPAYGCYTHGKYWHVYHDRLRDKSLEDDFQMTIICPNAELRAKTDEEKYFPRAFNDWDSWIKISVNWESVKTFVRYASKINKNIDAKGFIDNPQKGKFFEILTQADEAMLKDCFDKNDCKKEIPASFPIDFWIADGKRAVFAFSNYGSKTRMSRYGFITTDQTLIRAFQEMIEYYRC